MQIIVQKDDNKFINNLDSVSGHTIAYVDFSNNVYKIHQTKKPDLYIFVAEKLTHEEIHFCTNITDSKIIVYHITEQTTDVDNIKNIIHLYDKDIPLLYNPYRFFNQQNKSRGIDAAYFLDNETDINDDMTRLLYPNKGKYKIKMFNNQKINHVQNLGFLTENDKNNVLNDSQTYICQNQFYALEATLCGCKVLDTKLNEINLDPKKYQTYSDYIGGIIK